ncbi:uncharacterized protein LOC130649416 [Hydractinia symbiolongicarpus]|uniref:uncharacterized protein LOC130649416 n=1 Tax=Hydractinia symbiolongicarpus TaxID=13093 RepID=UPI00254C38BA|nr:uncharacterized protein LOC130649416 [Hydractinia symbiolongicarpus]
MGSICTEILTTVSHRCNDGKKCSKKGVEAESAALTIQNDKYFMKFYKNKKDLCKHELPLVGCAYIICEKDEDISKLNIYDVRVPQELPLISIKVKKKKSDEVSFEADLRNRLLAYSYLIVNVADKGCEPNFLHITSRFLCVTDFHSHLLRHKKSLRSLTININSHNEEVGANALVGPNYQAVKFSINDTENFSDSLTLLFKTAHVKKIYKTLVRFMKPEKVTCDINTEDEFPILDHVYDPVKYNPLNERKDMSTRDPVLTPQQFDDEFDEQMRPPPIPPKGIRGARSMRPRMYINVSNTELADGEYVKLNTMSNYSPIAIKYRDLNVRVNKEEAGENIKLFCSVFATKAVLSKVWLMVIIFIKQDDDEAFKKMKARELECNRHFLANLPFNTKKDVNVALNLRTKGFEILADREQVLSYDDLSELSHSSWIYMEYQLMCPTTKGSQNQIVATLSINEKSVSVIDELENKDMPVPSIPRTAFAFPLPTTTRLDFCALLDIHDALGNDWKKFAAEVGLSNIEISKIGSGKHQSNTEQVLLAMERSHPEQCDYHHVKSILEKMRRKDLVDMLVGANEGRAIEAEDHN